LEEIVRKIGYLVMLGLFALPTFAAEETYKNVPVVDVNCSAKAAAAPDSHTRACALKCSASGYGIITQDKKFIKFDAEGNTKITEALKASDKKDHLRVDVSGDVEGNTLKVTSIKLL
jgi:hypothetical protein